MQKHKNPPDIMYADGMLKHPGWAQTENTSIIIPMTTRDRDVNHALSRGRLLGYAYTPM
jgi:hypothetical protein